MDGRVVGLLVGAVGGTAFVVFNAPRVPAPFGVTAAVLAAVALVGLIVWILRQRRSAAVAGPGVGGAGEGPPAGVREEDGGGGGGMYGRRFRLVVAAEVVAIVGGAVVLGRLGLALAVLPWVVFVVGAHFVALGRVWRRASLAVVGVVVAVCGAVGFALAVAGAPDAAIAAVAGIAPGAALLAGCWWAAVALAADR